MLKCRSQDRALPVKVNEHDSGHFNNRKFIIKYVKLRKNRLRPPQSANKFMYNKILNKNSSCVVSFCHLLTLLHLSVSDDIVVLLLLKFSSNLDVFKTNKKNIN